MILGHQKLLKSITFLKIQYYHGIKKEEIKNSIQLPNPVKLAQKGKKI